MDSNSEEFMINTENMSLEKVVEKLFKIMIDNCTKGIWDANTYENYLTKLLLPFEVANYPVEFINKNSTLSVLDRVAKLEPNGKFMVENLNCISLLNIVGFTPTKKGRGVCRDTIEKRYSISNKYIDQWVEMGD